MSKLLKLGACYKPHGIKGAFTFNLDNDQDSALDAGVRIKLFPVDSRSKLPKEGQDFEIEKITFGHKVMAFLKGINDRNIVEEMIPFVIKIDRDNLPDLNEGEVYLDDLKGFKVLDENDEEIGRVQGFSDNGMQTIVEIRGFKSFDIPYIDQFVIETNLEEKFLKVVVPDYV